MGTFYEPPGKEHNKQWVAKNDLRPTNCKRTQSGQKVLYTIFFDGHGPVLQMPTPKGRTITGSYYANDLLSQFFRHYKKSD